MAVVSLRDISINFTGTVLLDGISMQIEPGERVCLLGRNGEGKSTLLSIIEGITQPDSGSVDYARGSRVAMLPQEVPQDLAGTIYDIAAQGLGAVGRHLSAYHAAAHALAESLEPDDTLVSQMEHAQHALEEAGGWPHHQTIETVLSHLKLDGDELFASLSGGTKRRALLARALVSGPDLLILDEPTNHLDIDSISWLEDFLLRQNAAVLFVTHDRAFLRRLATRIVELDRGKLFSWDCNYDTYLERKDAVLSAEAKQNHNFDRKLAEEETWIRQGIKARRTRNMGRVRDLRKMREERNARRDRTGSVRMVIQEAERTGKLVVEATDICFGYSDTPLITNFSTAIMRGDKIGLIGPNGAGKTTLLKILLGDIKPQSGSVRRGVNLQVSYFDQLREQLDETESARYNVADGNDFVTINGHQRHVMSHLKDFLFTPDRSRVPVSVLSGGERNRLLLARLFTRPANVLVMDEPTNDLDAETLDLLEELLMDYPGTLLLVSHDRDFLNNVVTSSIAFEDDGVVAEYVGGYDDWVRQRPDKTAGPVKTCKQKIASKPESPARRKLSYKEKFELEKKREALATMPALIERLETELEALQAKMSAPDYFKNSGEVMNDDQRRMETLESELEIAYESWEQLETALEGVELD
ncbi:MULTISPECIES: ATP-binding cassette domain-containing protein [unclassified Pseudodesulfovibrio]|uniref:ATP-binding cassette domain-containing protein n=1 Tax=unclassified Pseudodesulfovibrio TaxID=2661612 RepID=UPI000FEBB7A0|nr:MULTISPECIES: ATP-binding cassette domain-containing protein [unclassified Pseudodesulfovibrio]MCJ2163105.1 ATP-binding cassette domain-containing protein [Pseudodesulfovibrio sp. S3-i]RWU07097.1 ATP-binding cassette domain-containing protein [Pseudodesulfovibrio sp. S3]